ncbi:hypothetical protein N9J42_01040 [bacterium]|nr:hypothetical protein [bacterium]
MKLSNIILEYGEYEQEEGKLARDIKNRFDLGRVSVSMGNYSAGREDNDPLKDMSYGKITFMTRGDFEDSTWNKILSYVKSLDFEITSDSNYFDEDPGERYYYPSIKFHFRNSTK